MQGKNSELWRHPTLPIFEMKSKESSEKSSERLYLIPTLDTLKGEEIDQDCLPTPTSKSELPNVQDWVRRYVIGVVEIWSSQRPAMQLARWSHRKVFKQLTNPSPISNGAKIFRIHTHYRICHLVVFKDVLISDLSLLHIPMSMVERN